MGIIRNLGREWGEQSDGTLSGGSLQADSGTITTFTSDLATISRGPRNSVITANSTVSNQGYTYPVDSSGGAVTVTLASSMLADGAFLYINDEGGSAGLNAITIATEGTETIDGSSSVSIGSNYGALGVYSDGTNWFTLHSTAGGGTL